ncbi:NADH-quinone oxidoreductase subunit NuoE [Pseudodonghicola flavimaris]|uniref:NADH-quinone oxidoreductase subunit NuoE n=1 Tax=Pseudodonghicola flavimaris TaxID=3050036 RepID=A0ABT7EV16_9RHOB|nr:NADH-quinone oxidoreductase subunit NuoE [Pseudodonghicola flavimaris]MDK3016193.1 NADH-quinone oxidoreductase subunit NuoE [Pseudodonghicola flavimaris]
MLRRLHHDQPDSFAFTPANQAWAEAQITKYPEGRQASAVIPLLWRAQEQEGWLTRPAIEYVADFLGMAYIRVLEVASFYFMFQLQPVGSVAHIQVCGTTTCMICGAESLMDVCREKIAPKPHELSADGKFSWEEVECLGACANAPMAQIGKDYYEDLTKDRFAEILDELAAGEVPVPGPQNGRYSSEPKAGLVALTEFESGRTQYNASAARAVEIGDTIKRIDGTEVPLRAPWQGKTEAAGDVAVAEVDEQEPEILSAARDGGADDLKLLKGVGPKLEGMLNDLGIYHYDQIAAWTAAEIAWVDARLAFKGRIERDGWIEQARQLAAGEETEFAKRAKDDKIYE